MMHILYLCNEYPPFPHGGVGSFVQLMARQIVNRGHRASVLGLYPVDRLKMENDLGVDVYRLPARKNAWFDPLLNGRDVLSHIHQLNSIGGPIDIIEGSELSFGLLPGKLPAPALIRMHGGHHFFAATLGERKRITTTLIENISFSRAEFFCAVSHFAADTTRRLMRLGDRQIEVLPNPVDTELFRPRSDIPERVGLIIYNGGLRKKKGIENLLQAMPLILKEVPDATLWINGGDTMDRHTGNSYREYLETTIDPTIISHIEFRGRVPHGELPWINSTGSVLVFPSFSETQGMVVIEAMASGKAVVASQTGPGPEIIEDGKDGLFCDPYSPASIAEKVILLLQNRDLREKLSASARASAEKNFSVDGLVKKNLEFYQRCLGAR